MYEALKTSSGWKVLFIGFGYCAQYLYHRLKKANKFSTFYATSRDSQKLKTPSDIEIIDVKNYRMIPLSLLQEITHILISTPPDNSQDYFYQQHSFILPKLESLQWLGYLSSTSVYGDHQGQWVFETSVCKPQTTQGRDRLKIEDYYLRAFYNFQTPTHIFRLSGIYGPGRSAFDQLKKPPIVRINAPGNRFSRIHVEDIGLSLYQSMKGPTPGQIYNLADYEPIESRYVMEYACELTGQKPPPLVSLQHAEISEKMREFYCDNKQVNGNKIRSLLKFDIQYSTYKEGLKAIYESEKK